MELGCLPRPAPRRALPATLLLNTAGSWRWPPGTSQSQRSRARTTLCPRHPTGPSPRSHTLDRALGASQSLGKLQVSWEMKKKATEQKGTEKGRSSAVGSPRVEVGTLRVRKGPGSRAAPDHPLHSAPLPSLARAPAPPRQALPPLPAGPFLSRGARARGLREGGGRGKGKL